MKIGIVGSRSIDVPIPEKEIDGNISMIYTGGAKGIDKRVRDFAYKKGITVTEILPEYNLYGKYAPIVRNELIVRLSDFVYIFWDGESRGTKSVIRLCKKNEKPYKLFLWQGASFSLVETNE